MEKQPTFQGLMDSAYKRWHEDESKSYEDMLKESTEHEKTAVLLGNLNYQVCNGGFRQWVDNGYGVHIEEVIKTLKEIDTKNSLKVVLMLERFKGDINTNKKNQGFFTNYWNEDICPSCGGDGYYSEGDEDYDCDECCGEGRIGGAPDFLDELDSQYYELNEELLNEIEAYLTKQPITA